MGSLAALPYPHINPVFLELGPLQFRWYGLMYLVGFLAAWWLGRHRAALPGSTWAPADVDDLIFDAMLGVVLGEVAVDARELGQQVEIGRQARDGAVEEDHVLYDGGPPKEIKDA